MPKGDGSPRIQSLGVDLLEARLLLSRGTAASAGHAITTTPVQVSPLPVVSHSDVDSGHSVSMNDGDLQERDAEAVAAAIQAASISSKDQFTIPLIFTSAGIGSEEMSSSMAGSPLSSRILRVSYGEEHVAWSVSGPSFSNTLLTTQDRSELTPQIPESSLDTVLDVESSSIDGLINDRNFQEALGEVATRGADLLAPYLPVDRMGLEQAIDRLLDGIEVLGQEMTGDAEGADVIPLPIAWGIGLAVVEIARRRLRSVRQKDDEPDRDPALGLRGSAG